MVAIMKPTKIIAAAVAALLLSACSHQIVRPAPAALALGKSHYSDVVALLGEPTFKNENVTINNEKIRTVDYYAYRFARTSLDNAPHRYLHCSFFNDILVGKEYNSSYKEDSTWFDAQKAAALVIGKSTRADVIAALGPASGEIIYPLVRDKNGSGLVYWYTLYYGLCEYRFCAGTRMVPSRLVVFLDDKGIVTDISYKDRSGVEQYPNHVTSRLSEQQFPVSPLTY